MQKFINAAFAVGLAFAAAPALADGFGTPGFSASPASTSPLPSGGWGLIIDTNVNWMSGTLGQGSTFSSDPTLEGTVDVASEMFEDVVLSTATTAGPDCGITCENVNISLDGTWNAQNAVTATMLGSGPGTVGAGGVITPFSAGARAQTQGMIDMTGAFQFTYGPDVTIPAPAPAN
jgi:hypothetical protein